VGCHNQLDVGATHWLREVNGPAWLLFTERSTAGLILRTRANYGPRLYRLFTMPLILVGGEFFTARKMLYGIKRRVEYAAG
jgi:hypothetical protein